MIDGKAERAHITSYLLSKFSMMIGKVHCVAGEDSRLNHLEFVNKAAQIFKTIALYYSDWKDVFA